MDQSIKIVVPRLHVQKNRTPDAPGPGGQVFGAWRPNGGLYIKYIWIHRKVSVFGRGLHSGLSVERVMVQDFQG